MSTPPYFPPSIGPAGLQVPAYQSILADNIQAFLNIYGTNQYVAPDSAIYQLLSIISPRFSRMMESMGLYGVLIVLIFLFFFSQYIFIASHAIFQVMTGPSITNVFDNFQGI